MFRPMITKADVFKKFGGEGITLRRLALTLGLKSHGTIISWPEAGALPQSAQDRVIVTLLSRGEPIPKGWVPLPPQL